MFLNYDISSTINCIEIFAVFFNFRPAPVNTRSWSKLQEINMSCAIMMQWPVVMYIDLLLFYIGVKVHSHGAFVAR